MKKYLLLLLLQLFGYYGFAQFNIGVVGGLNYSSVSYPASATPAQYYSSSESFKPGFNVGFMLENTFGNFSFQPGVIYTSKGGKFNSSYLYSSTTANQYLLQTSDVTLNYVQIPLNLVYNFPVSAGKYFVGFGPYVSFFTSGTDKYVYTEPTGHTTAGTNSISTDYETGINLLAGMELKSGMFFKINFEYGPNSIYTYNEDIKNYGAGLSVGYVFKRKEKAAK